MLKLNDVSSTFYGIGLSHLILIVPLRYRTTISENFDVVKMIVRNAVVLLIELATAIHDEYRVRSTQAIAHLQIQNDTHEVESALMVRRIMISGMYCRQ